MDEDIIKAEFDEILKMIGEKTSKQLHWVNFQNYNGPHVSVFMKHEVNKATIPSIIDYIDTSGEIIIKYIEVFKYTNKKTLIFAKGNF